MLPLFMRVRGCLRGRSPAANQNPVRLTQARDSLRIWWVLVALADVEMYGTLLYPSHLVDEDTVEKMKSKNII